MGTICFPEMLNKFKHVVTEMRIFKHKQFLCWGWRLIYGKCLAFFYTNYNYELKMAEMLELV